MLCSYSIRCLTRLSCVFDYRNFIEGQTNNFSHSNLIFKIVFLLISKNPNILVTDMQNLALFGCEVRRYLIL